jgi:hypothetical protein
VNDLPILSDAETDQELRQFALFARGNPNAKIHVKRWSKTVTGYEFGYVIVANGKVIPTVYVPMTDGTHARFTFDALISLVNAGWIGD